jgi:polyhydroxyalkanoate synthesis regulator phasin
MASNERIRKYLDAGTVLGQVSRGRAEEIVRELVNAGDIQRSQAQEWVDSLTDRSRRTSEQVLDLVRHEVATQLDRLDRASLERLANQVADVLKKSAEAGRKTTRDVSERAGKVTQQAGKTAKDVRSRADETGKSVRSQAERTVKGVRSQAGTAATRARAAATKVTPVRGQKDSAPKAGGAKPGAKATKHAARDKDPDKKPKKAAS